MKNETLERANLLSKRMEDIRSLVDGDKISITVNNLIFFYDLKNDKLIDSIKEKAKEDVVKALEDEYNMLKHEFEELK